MLVERLKQTFDENLLPDDQMLEDLHIAGDYGHQVPALAFLLGDMAEEFLRLVMMILGLSGRSRTTTGG